MNAQHVIVALVLVALLLGSPREQTVVIQVDGREHEFTHTYDPWVSARYGCTFTRGEFVVAKHGIARTAIDYTGMTPETLEWRIRDEYYNKWIKYGGQNGGDVYVNEARKLGVTIILGGDSSWDVRPIEAVRFSDSIMRNCR